MLALVLGSRFPLLRPDTLVAHHADMSFFPRRRAFAWFVVRMLLFLTTVVQAAPEPVTFAFTVPSDQGNPFARDLWAEIITPSGKTLRLPAYFAGQEQFAVRARAEVPGDYRLGKITEIIKGRTMEPAAKLSGSDRVQVRTVEDRPAVQCAAGDPARLVLSNGTTYVPIGANLAWPDTGGVRFYHRAFDTFAKAGLNWTRIWMVHWGGLNLDWLPPEMGRSPPPGSYDLRVAADWDAIVSRAEERGVYLQIVLQYHGQYSTVSDSSWSDNPWNAANPGGFLHSPDEFFTSPRARELTALKYRYVVARWGYSPAVLAWELFNEVHWVDAISLHHHEDTVARWHAEMAAFIRSTDRYHHLITTSTENLRSPIYADMDYFQPHLYPANLLAGVRRFDPAPAKLDRPVFYGEMGDENTTLLNPEEKASGVGQVPPVWTSVMGQGRYPAQAWNGARLIETGRIGELGAVSRFLAATGLGQREGLTPFSAVVECAGRVPLGLAAGQVWEKRPAPEMTVPLDGRQPIEFADIPQIYVGAPDSLAAGYPGRATYHIEFPAPVTLRLHVADTSRKGAAIRVSLDGKTVVEKTWPARPTESGGRTAPNAAEFSFPVTAGAHTIVVENPGVPDWFDLRGIDLGLDTSVLAAVGRRGRDFMTLWVWHRTGVFALNPPAPVTGTLLLEDVPAGTWQVTWWDTLKGIPAAPIAIEHSGGLLRLPVPPINRHAAVVLTRER
jgi:hypothetical protein